MEKSGFYKVAGHCFRISLPNSDRLAEALARQYDPFAVESAGEAPVFSLEYTDKCPAGERVCVYDAPTENGETVIKLYRSGEDWIFEASPDKSLPVAATVKAGADFSKAVIFLHSRRLHDAVFAMNNAAMMLYTFATAGLDTVEMHASVISNGGKAYLFLGKSGTGKSTHSRLWLENIEGSELINDDNPVVRVEDGVVTAYGTPWSGKTPCYRNLSAPVGGFVQIRQCPENKICRMSVLESYTSLYSSISGIKDDDSAMADGINGAIDKILSAVPCWLLDCRPDSEAALLCASKIRP